MPPDFSPDARRAMTPARKARIWSAWDGKCWFCRMPVAQDGPSVEYDHIPALWMKGSDADDDIGPIHADPCHRLKTAADAAKRAKVKRIWKKSDPDRIKSGRRIQSAGFRKDLSRKMDGTVEKRR
jgi:5-methylcytosine-specific restriction enzyme A